MTTTPPSTFVQCPAGCGREQKPGKLLCSICWAEVPKHVQREVYRTWTAYRNANVRAPGFLEISKAYRAARDAAIGSVR